MFNQIVMDNKKQYFLETYQLFLILTITMLINMWLFQTYVMTKEVYYNLLSERMEYYYIDKQFDYIRIIILLWLLMVLLLYVDQRAYHY